MKKLFNILGAISQYVLILVGMITIVVAVGITAYPTQITAVISWLVPPPPAQASATTVQPSFHPAAHCILTNDVREALERSWSDIDDGINPPFGVSSGLVTILWIPNTDSVSIVLSRHDDCGCRKGVMNVWKYFVKWPDLLIEDSAFYSRVIVGMYPTVPVTVTTMKGGGF